MCSITVMPSTIEMDFPQVTKQMNYTGTCRATGNPAPLVEAELNVSPTDCPYTTSYTKADTYTGEVVITIPHVTERCHNVTVHCYVRCRHCQTEQSKKLNVTRLSTNEGE